MTVLQAQPARSSDTMQFNPHWEFRVSPALSKPRAGYVFAKLLDAVHLDGDVAEFGVWEGRTSYEMIKFLEVHRIPKTVHLFDTFTGLPALAEQDYDAHGACSGTYQPGLYGSPEHAVRELLQDCQQFAIHAGLFVQTGKDFETPLCFAHIDADLYEGTRDAIQICERVMVPGGVIVIDDYGTEWAGVTHAVKEYLLSPAWDAYVLHTKQCFAYRR